MLEESYQNGQTEDSPQCALGRGLRSLCDCKDTLHSQPVFGAATM